uniref:Carbohydrate kinase PfkB domain-containing protein n=1 Tax=Romanomermis culicivorax TaxID=13658 RepID=A0A915IQR2_ROMCU
MISVNVETKSMLRRQSETGAKARRAPNSIEKKMKKSYQKIRRDNRHKNENKAAIFLSKTQLVSKEAILEAMQSTERRFGATLRRRRLGASQLCPESFRRWRLIRVLRQLGIDCSLYASFGDPTFDITSQMAVKQLTNMGCDISRCENRTGQSLSISVVLVDPKKGSRTIVHHRRSLAEPKFEEFSNKYLVSSENQPQSDPPIAKYDAIFFEGRNVPEVRKMLAHVIKWRSTLLNGNAKRPLIIVELEKPREDLEGIVMPGVDCVIIGKDYAKALPGQNIENMFHAAEYFAHFFAAKLSPDAHIFCPWGDKGACLAHKGRFYTSPAFTFNGCSSSRTHFLDTLGAGDTFIAACVKGLVDGSTPPDEILKNGCKIAGYKCGLKGFEFPSNFDVNSSLNDAKILNGISIHHTNGWHKD